MICIYKMYIHMNMYSYKGVNWCYPIQGVMLFLEDIGCQIEASARYRVLPLSC